LTLLVLGTAAIPGLAQTTGQDPAPLIIDAVPAPETDASARYQAALARSGNHINATYAKKITGDLPLDGAYRPPPKQTERRGAPAINGMVAWIMVIVLVVVLLALWLRFGGSGTLLAGTPKEIRQKPVAPDGWKMAQDDDVPMADLLAQIAAMPDRRAALVRLLRHCLLQAGAATDTRFARSDTEREALRRLPMGWSGRSGVSSILTATELAHYGGREVSEDAFAASLATARALFASRQAPHA
jgi:hypothetical protein